MTDGDLRFKQAFWDKHGIMRKMEETMTAEQIKNYGSSLKELENRKSIRAVCPFCLYVGTLDKFTVLRDNKKIQVNLECPECGAGMKEKTTKIFDKGPVEYSIWFWTKFYLSFEKEKKKFVFDSVKKVVRRNGFSTLFWDIQKQLKSKYRSASMDEEEYKGPRPSTRKRIREHNDKSKTKRKTPSIDNYFVQ